MGMSGEFCCPDEYACKNNYLSRAILVLQTHCQIYARGERFEAFDGDLVVGLHFVVIGGISERECKHALLLQVGLFVKSGSDESPICRPGTDNDEPREYGRSCGR